MTNSNLKVHIQRFGSKLSGMVMPNIGAFIAWGLITALFIETGWLPNEQLATLVGPTLTYLLPLLIAYTGGYMVYEQRGAVVGAIGTMGVIVGSDVPMFIGAMIMGPLGGWCIKKFDELFQGKIKTGFEMLVNNFSSGILGFILAILGYYGIGPIVTGLTHLMADGVEKIISMHLLPLANILIEPAKILFLNNAINHGILTPLGADQVSLTGKSILFLLEANPGPGLGILLAFTLFGKGSAKSSAPGAIIIQFFGGIHEIYFPYVMMKPALILAVIGGGVSGTFIFQLFDGGLQAAASPGSIFAILAMTPKGTYLANILGILIATIVSFIIAAFILKLDKSQDIDNFNNYKESMKNAKQHSKDKKYSQSMINDNNISIKEIKKIIFACDAGMGSSAMGASILKKKVKDADIKIDVTNKAINNLHNDSNVLIITQEELYDRVKEKAPSSKVITVSNFMDSARYDEILGFLTQDKLNVIDDKLYVDSCEDIVFKDIEEIVFLFTDNKGSANMGKITLLKKIYSKNIHINVSVLPLNNIVLEENVLYIVNSKDKGQLTNKANNIVYLDNFVTTDWYDNFLDNFNY